MKVLFYCFSPSGGFVTPVEMLVKTLARQFPEDTYYVACLRSSQIASWTGSSNMKIIPIEAGLSNEWTRFQLSTGRLARLARENQADVLWSINVGPYHRTGIPQVLSLQNAYEVYPWAVTAYHPQSSLRLALLRLFFRLSLRKSDALITQTPLMAKYASQIRGAPGRIATIPKAIESTDVAPGRPLPDQIARQLDGGLGRSAFTFVYAAVAWPHKNHATLVSAMNILRSEGVKARIALTISAEELVGLAGSKAQELIEDGYLLSLRWVANEHLRSLYDACDACVMPSLLESLSSSHLEAMQWGKPQISADLPFAPDLCGDATIYANPTDPVDWAAKMRMLIEDQSIRDRLLQAGSRQMERFPKTWVEVASRIHQLFQELVDSKKARS